MFKLSGFLEFFWVIKGDVDRIGVLDRIGSFEFMILGVIMLDGFSLGKFIM